MQNNDKKEKNNVPMVIKVKGLDLWAYSQACFPYFT